MDDNNRIAHSDPRPVAEEVGIPLFKRMAAARDAATHSPAPMAGVWQPIATVDRVNARRLILAWDDCPTLPYHWEVGHWSRDKGWVNTYGHAFSGEPTHWMEPFPPAAAHPSTQEGADRG